MWQSCWMLVAALLFSMTGIGIRMAGSSCGFWVIVLARNAIGLAVAYAILRAAGTAIRSSHPWLQLCRSGFGNISLAISAYTLITLPMQVASTTNNAGPLWLAVIAVSSALLARCRPQWSVFLAVFAGFAGVLLMFRPTLPAEQLFSLTVGVVGIVTGGTALWFVALLGRHREPETRTVFWLMFLGTAMALPGALMDGFAGLTLPAAGWLAFMGFCSVLAQMAMTRAIGRGHVLLSAIFQFTAIPFGAFWGWLLFGDRVDSWTWLGIAVVTVSAVAATVLVKRSSQP